jgi:enoyl-CoA hydratase/carnithine racemase
MTNYADIDFSPILAETAGEVVTHSPVRDIRLASGKVLALITLDNGRDHTRPNTLGPATLSELDTTLEGLRSRAAAGEIQAVGITGKQYILAAGADLSDISRVGSKENAKLVAQLGHMVLGKLSELGVPSFAFVNGLALGGGLEIALNSTYRTVDASAAAIALPEVFLGIIPGWGGAYLLPNLIGIENALEVVISNPLKQNRMLKPQQAFDYGIVDLSRGFPELGRQGPGRQDQGRPQERARQDRAPHQVAHCDQDGARHAGEPDRHCPEVPVCGSRPAREGEERHEGRGLRA